jgi:hypothetical protein
MIMRRGEQKDRGRRRIGSVMIKHRRDRSRIQEGASSGRARVENNSSDDDDADDEGDEGIRRRIGR